MLKIKRDNWSNGSWCCYYFSQQLYLYGKRNYNKLVVSENHTWEIMFNHTHKEGNIPKTMGALAPVSWMQIKKIEHRQPFYSLSGFTREVHIYNLQASWKVKWFYTHNHIMNCIKDNLLNFLRGGLYIYHIAWFRTHRYSTH